MENSGASGAIGSTKRSYVNVAPIDVPRKLDEYRVHDAPTREELETMGWHDPDDENVYHIAFYRHLGVE